MRSVAAFDRMMDRSDPEVMRHYSRQHKRSIEKDSKIPHGPEVLALCKSEIIEPEIEEMEIEEIDSRDSNKNKCWDIFYNFTKKSFKACFIKFNFLCPYL